MSATNFKPETPKEESRPGMSLADKIISVRYGQRVEYKDYDVGMNERTGKYYANWEYGCYGMKNRHRDFETIEDLEKFLNDRGMSPEKFSVEWDACLFNGL